MTSDCPAGQYTLGASDRRITGAALTHQYENAEAAAPYLKNNRARGVDDIYGFGDGPDPLAIDVGDDVATT